MTTTQTERDGEEVFVGWVKPFGGPWTRAFVGSRWDVTESLLDLPPGVEVLALPAGEVPAAGQRGLMAEVGHAG